MFYITPAMSDDTGKRMTFKRTRPNSLFQGWLEELHEEAKSKKSKLEPMLKEALDSISKYPLPLDSGAECIILKGFKKKLCLHLDQRLAVYKHNLALRQNSDTSSNDSNSRKSVSSLLTAINENGTVKDGPSQNGSAESSINGSGQASQSDAPILSQGTAVSTGDSNPEQPSPSSSGSKKQRAGRKYMPAHRSGAYAILIALLEDSIQRPGNLLTKEEVIDKAQKHSEESFIRPKPETFYTAWSNMSKLVTKGLVIKVRDKKVKYQLTDSGLELAKQVHAKYKSVPTANDIIFREVASTCRVQLERCNGLLHEVVPSTSSANENDISTNGVMNSSTELSEVIDLRAGSFDIILLIDKNETGGVSKKNDPTVAQFKKYPDLNHEYRSLKVGDFTWIARHKVDKHQELVLPFVIERKRMDDLAASIKDGRFHEQKFRLRKCGLKRVHYLVENYGGNKNVGLPLQHLMQALANTRIQDGFKVHITDSLTNSARFLAMMTKRLTIRYKDKDLKGRSEDPDDEYLMSFDYFNKASAKSKALTVTETFIKLLLQLKGVSAEKALAITARYSTPRALIVAYQKCDQNEGEFLLANLKYGRLGRNVGPAVSKAIYQLFTSHG